MNDAYIKRDRLLEKLKRGRKKDIVKIITGLRRSGKSVLLNNIFYDYLLSDGVPKDHIIKLSLDLKKWAALRDGDELYNYIAQNIKNDELYYVFIDEIQMADGFEEVVNSIKAEFNADVYITGSNSKLLSHDISTIFRGRGLEIKVFPLSFSEFLQYRNIDKREAFEEYITFGGLPYAVLETEIEGKRSYLNMIFNTVVARDMLERYKIRNSALFISIIELLCSSIGSYVSSAKIANTLKSNGFRTADNETVSRYLSYMLDSFLFYRADRYDIKGKEYLKTQHKYYAADMGLRNAAIQYRQIEITHIIENVVYLELIRRGYVADIGRNREKEIDFVVRALNGRQYYIQVSYSIEDKSVKERELSAFRHLDDGFKKILITMDHNPLTNLENGYQMINLFDFLLNEDALERL
ncbi:MAG: ATP-binding protein [bacterium]|nr:ATP-binding protein [bacterium]